MPRLRIAVGTLAVLAALVALARFLERASLHARPNVLLVGIDTLRADRLGCYGYSRPTSPHIDRLAEESVFFEQAISQAPWTLPAFASIMTGVLPNTHGGGRGKGWQCDRLKPGRPTMATLLRAAGYRTASFVTNGWVGREAGMAEGVDPADTVLWVESGGTLAAALKWLRENPARPFFMFLHTVDPHAPYTPAPEDLAALGLTVDPAAAARINQVVGNQRPVTDLQPEDRAALSDLYDADVHQADRRIGVLRAALEELDLLDRTIVVVVSDHGEELLEHDGTGHGHSLYDELLRVPLLIRFPGGRWARRIPQQVRTMDVLPTILEALDLPVPPDLDGRSLWPLIRPDTRPSGPRSAPAEFLWVGEELKAVRHDEAKMLLTASTGELRWYDLEADPEERSPIPGIGGDGATLHREMERVFAARLDGVRFTAYGDTKERDVRLVLSTDSRFEEAVVMGREGKERVVLSSDRRRAKVRLRLYASYFPPAGVDIDSVRVRTEANAPIRATVEVDGLPLHRSRVRLGTANRRPKPEQPWTFKPDDTRVVVPQGFLPARDPLVTLTVTSQGLVKAPQAPLSEQTKESLRALGYIQ